MATTTPVSLNIPPSRPTHSCIRCAERKVKCDRKTPCSACTRHDVDCVFNPSHPPRNKRKRLHTQKILTDQLRHYEALLREKGIDPNQLQQGSGPETCHRSSHTVAVVPNEPQLHILPSIAPESRRSVNKAQVIQGPGRFKFIDNMLWTRIVEEFHDPQDALGNSSDDTNDPEVSDDDFSFVLGNQPRFDTKSRHPPPEGIYQLWQIFVENIDPLTKVIHVPTLQPAIEKAAKNIGATPRSLEALMFAIYSAAIMSLTDDECTQRLYEPRQVLLSRYVSATKAALTRTNFMGTTNLVVIQALLIHLLAVRDIYEPRAVWSLTGVAVRIAQGMGLDRDGVHLGLPPFETEIRRRIWWQLKMHDFRTGELCGIGKFQDLHTGAECTKWPTNTNDDQLYPGMTSFTTKSKKLTDAVFISLKCELLNNAAGRAPNLRQQGKTSKPWDPLTLESDTAEVDESSREIEELLETKYLRYCDPSQPLHLMVMLMARCSINVIRFMSHHPRRWASREQTPDFERQFVWDLCIGIFEQHNMLQSNPKLKQYSWHAPYYQQWHAIIHILDTLRANPLHSDAEKAWKHIGSIYENNPDLTFDMRKPIHVAVGGLCLKAYGNREATLQNGNTRSPHPSPIPHFIVQLRQQCDAVKFKRQERHAKNGGQSEYPVSSNGQENDPNNDPKPRRDSDSNNPDDTSRSTYPKRGTAPLPPPPGLIPAGTPTVPLEDDLFQFSTYGFDDDDGGQVGGDMNNVNLHLGFMLDQDCGMEEGSTATSNTAITWDQWDSWLTDSNIIRPFSSSKEDSLHSSRDLS